ncbi:hypothetical protein [Halomarina rubra]|uniref:AlkP-core domain protein n=1 Tax=Halomarina rubra TaxID=2071873 RepID=A0ABD6ATM5_9EURY|nr:hypothetical protein [Halomarina rubra]
MAPFDTLRYVVDELREHAADRLWWKQRLVQRVAVPTHRRLYGDRGVRVMDEDWDSLFVLDACRADLFATVTDLDRFDAYRTERSPASMTAEWTETQFAGREFGDTVYVSANPYTSTVAGDSFHELVEVWREGFDEEEATVLAEDVAAAARDAHERHPDKRLVVHFMQPHYPFVGHPDLRYASWSPDEILDGAYANERPHDPWQALDMGLVDHEQVLSAYADNLRYVLDEAFDLAADVGGTTVLTSDHGNLMGERMWPLPVRGYGHPRGLRSAGLVDVPWAVLDGDRREVTDDGVTAVEEAASEEVESRLQALGYR